MKKEKGEIGIIAFLVVAIVILSFGLTDYINRKMETLGATIPKAVALFETTLASKISSTATSMTMTSGTDKSGDSLSGYICYIIDEGTASEEFVCGTTSGTAVSSMIRGIDPIDGDEEVSSLKKSHRRGASIKVSDYPVIGVITRIINGDETFPNKLTYASQPSLTGDEDIATKKYIDDISIAGCSNISETVKGIGELASIAELSAGTATGGTGANLLAHAEDFGNTSSAKQMVAVTDADGDIPVEFMELNATWAFTGTTSFAGSTNISTATNWKLGGVAYTGAMADLNEAEVFFGATNITGAEAEDLTDGGASTAHHHSNALGAYASKSVDTAYQATTDGILFGIAALATSGDDTVTVLSDTNATPTTKIWEFNGAGSNQDTISFSLPIKKDNYYKVVDNNSTITYLTFIPFDS